MGGEAMCLHHGCAMELHLHGLAVPNVIPPFAPEMRLLLWCNMTILKYLKCVFQREVAFLDSHASENDIPRCWQLNPDSQASLYSSSC